MTGFLHSIESMGTVDGPGIRTVVFLQGCALRCQYCHNPDTWHAQGGQQITPEALVKKLRRFQPYYVRSGGGVTFSGGEPLLQPDFLAECLRLCRAEGIHTCIDTAGVGLGDYDAILQNTDLVLYDVKHEDPVAYQALTGQPIGRTHAFVEAVRRSGVPMWVRHVVVPGVTDGESHLERLAQYVRTLPNVQRVELLPYHLLGVNKYAVLGLPYPLAGVPAMDRARCEAFQDKYFGGFVK